jgi:copper homeostasis protein CutC
MDGTFYLGNQLIEGSLDFLQALKRTGRSCLFLTNNSSKSASFYQDKLERMNVRAPFRRVLTSGQAPDAWYGAEVIRQMIEFAQGAIEILPGGGVTPDNAARILARTGCTEIHASASETRNGRKTTSAARVAAIRQAISDW